MDSRIHRERARQLAVHVRQRLPGRQTLQRILHAGSHARSEGSRAPFRLPHQVVGDDGILVGIVLIDGRGRGVVQDDRLRITLTDAGRDLRRHDFVMLLVTNDGQLAVDQTCTQRGIHRNPADLLLVDEPVSLVTLDLRQAVLLDDLLDLSDPRPALGLVLTAAIQLLVALDLRFVCLLRLGFRRRLLPLSIRRSLLCMDLRRRLLRRWLRSPLDCNRRLRRPRAALTRFRVMLAELPLLFLLLRLARLFLSDEPGGKQLVAQRTVHG